MDLAGYEGDFHRHRVNEDVKKRVGLTETEFLNMIYQDDKLKEIAFTLRDIDPDRNGFVT
jgi:hypothetical protein